MTGLDHTGRKQKKHLVQVTLARKVSRHQVRTRAVVVDSNSWLYMSGLKPPRAIALCGHSRAPIFNDRRVSSRFRKAYWFMHPWRRRPLKLSMCPSWNLATSADQGQWNRYHHWQMAAGLAPPLQPLVFIWDVGPPKPPNNRFAPPNVKGESEMPACGTDSPPSYRTSVPTERWIENENP